MNVISTNTTVSVTLVTNGKVSIASIDNLMDGCWWISRVNVQGVEKGKGTGSKLLQKAIESVLSYGPADIIVAPGGYNEDKEKQFNFYKKNGFVDSSKKGLLIYKKNK